MTSVLLDDGLLRALAIALALVVAWLLPARRHSLLGWLAASVALAAMWATGASAAITGAAWFTTSVALILVAPIIEEIVRCLAAYRSGPVLDLPKIISFAAGYAVVEALFKLITVVAWMLEGRTFEVNPLVATLYATLPPFSFLFFLSTLACSLVRKSVAPSLTFFVCVSLHIAHNYGINLPLFANSLLLDGALRVALSGSAAAVMLWLVTREKEGTPDSGRS